MTGRRMTTASLVEQDELHGDAKGRSPGPRDKIRLFLASFLVLFVELALIRWTGANVIFLSYFSNFVLLASFLGIGIGFLRARSRVDLFPWALVALSLLVLFVPVFLLGAASLYLYNGPYTAVKQNVVLPTVRAKCTIFFAEGS